MAFSSSLYLVEFCCMLITLTSVIRRLFVHPLKAIPGPWLYALTPWRLAYDDLLGQTSRKIHSLHSTYGPVIRIGPNHVIFNSLTALKTIYGVGSRSNRTSFYKIFEPYGQPTMFTFSSSEDHAERKKFLVRAYAKTGIVKGCIAANIESKVAQCLRLFQQQSDATEICHLLYYFTLDVSSAFIFTPQLGTEALSGDETHRTLVHDLGLSRRGSRRSVPGIVYTRLLQYLNIEKTISFKDVREWALQAFDQYHQIREDKSFSDEVALVAELWNQREKRDGADRLRDMDLASDRLRDSDQASDRLRDVDLASECADHLAAGVETTRHTMVFLIWAMSLPENAHIQLNIRREVQSLDPADLNEYGLPTVEAASKLTYVNAVVRETLRIYPPLPQLQPRFFDFDMVIDGYFIPARTTVSMAPFTQHRNEEVFDDPYRFNPERWLGEANIEMQRWWWPFSNGGRACTGIHLAMATMTTLVAALYSKYETRIHPSFEGISPAIISLFETFWDERYNDYKENTCLINFQRCEPI